MFARFANVRSKGDFWYEALTDDPQCRWSFRLLTPRFCAVGLDATAAQLDPRLYFDWGYGFEEEHSVALSYKGPSLYVIGFPSGHAPRALRFDPASRPCSFRFVTGQEYFRQTTDRLVSRLTESLRQKDGPEPRLVRMEASRPRQPKPRDRERTVRRLSDFQKHVIALARDVPSFQPRSSSAPFISIVVPTYNTPPSYLRDLLRSFARQAFPAAELILSDDGSSDPRTRQALRKIADEKQAFVVTANANGGIATATNRGLEAARGEWVTLLDHDDALSDYALKVIAAAIARFPAAQFFYTDEFITDKNLKVTGCHLKPAFDPVLLSGVNYINHFSIYRRQRLLELGGLRSGYDGSQDYELLLRYLTGLAPDQVCHIPYPAYLWRRTPQAFSARFMDRATISARRALSQHLAPGRQLTIDAALESTLHKPRFDALVRQWPLVSVVIPNRDSFDLVSRVLTDLRTRTDYDNLEVIVVDNGSKDPAILDLYRQAEGWFPRFKADIEAAPFNFARQVNRGMELASGDHFLLLNNDIEVVSRDWLKEMVSCMAYPHAGVVGARLLYPDGTLQHAGVIVGLAGIAGHWYVRKPGDHPGPFARLKVRQSMSAVTAACLLVSRQCFDGVGPFDEENFAIAFNDVDFCLRAGQKGYRIVWTPFATLVHHESVTRGSDELPQNRERFAAEKRRLVRLRGTDKFVDPAFNPWYTLNHSDPGLRLLPTLPEPRTGHPPRTSPA